MRTLLSVIIICIVAHITSHDVLFMPRGLMASAMTAAARRVPRCVMIMKMAKGIMKMILVSSRFN